MAEFKYTCPRCGKQLTASKGKKISNRVYHIKCYDEKIKEELAKQQRKKEKEINKVKKAKQKEEEKLIIPEAVPEDEAKAREHFFELVKRITGNTHLSAKTYALADRYKKEYKDFTWYGMEQTLVYAFKLKENEINDEVVGIIPWLYTEATEYYKSLEEIVPVKENLKDLYKTRKVKIHPKYDNVPSIDISQLGV